MRKRSGLSDISMLKELAKVFDVSMEEILNGERSSKQNIEEKLQKINEELINVNRQRIKKISIIIVALVLMIICILFKNIHLGFNLEELKYEHENTSTIIGIPKSSFMIKNNDCSYSFKNLRNPYIVENEVKEYLGTLKYSVCSDTIYYYNEQENFSIISYDVKNKFFIIQFRMK